MRPTADPYMSQTRKSCGLRSLRRRKVVFEHLACRGRRLLEGLGLLMMRRS